MATPKVMYDTVSKSFILNVSKYFKDEAMKFPPNHPRRSYVKKTMEATGLPQRTISLIYEAPSLLRQVPLLQLRTTPPELPASSTADWIQVPDKRSPPATRKVYPRATIVDDADKCVIRRKYQRILQSGSSYPPLTSCCQFFVQT